MRGRGERRRQPEEEEEGEGWRERPLKQWVESIISFLFFFHPGLLREGGSDEVSKMEALSCHCLEARTAVEEGGDEEEGIENGGGFWIFFSLFDKINKMFFSLFQDM